MKMRNTLFAMFALVAGLASAQVATESAGGNEKTLFERIAKIENAVEAGDVDAAATALQDFGEWCESFEGQERDEVEKAVEKHSDRIIDAVEACEALVISALYEEYDEYYYE